MKTIKPLALLGLRIKVRIFFRRLRRVCLNCGDTRHRGAKGCYHCRAFPLFCHGCAKARNFGKTYGAGPAGLARILQRRTT